MHLDPKLVLAPTLPPKASTHHHFSSFSSNLSHQHDIDRRKDIGKQVAAGTGGEFRRISNASGPQASAGQYVSTQDIGKQVAAGTGGEYRRIVTATGIYLYKITLLLLLPLFYSFVFLTFAHLYDHRTTSISWSIQSHS